MLRFSQIENKFGPGAAYYCLLEIEKAAHIRSSEMVNVDLETRFQYACRIQDALILQGMMGVGMSNQAA